MTASANTGRKTCFVAMPVTTPVSYAEDLRDPDHFSHVLTHLFTPALERAGYTVIPPKMLGATLIHAEIIRHLEQAELVLADLSDHNANVFFELGIRTSLDRPVVLVKDKRTTKMAFDVGTINILTYDESLAPWTLENEVSNLADHVSKVPVDGDSGNDMWRYFGLTKRGGPAEAGSLDEKVDLLLTEMEKLRLAPMPKSSLARPGLSDVDRMLMDNLRGSIETLLAQAGYPPPDTQVRAELLVTRAVSVAITGPSPGTEEFRHKFTPEIRRICDELGLRLDSVSLYPQRAAGQTSQARSPKAERGGAAGD